MNLRIAHVVAIYSEDGAYGGPTQVALAQTRQLAANGHDVTLFAGWMGPGNPPETIHGVRAVLRPVRRVIPRSGFAGLVAPGLLSEFKKVVDTFDMVHIHLARDLITLPIARFANANARGVILQPHGMIVPSTHPLAGPLDLLMTTSALTKAGRVLALTEEEGIDLEKVAGTKLDVAILGNGIEIPPHRNEREQSSREVIFLARLHRRKRPLAFVEAAIELAPKWPDVIFTLVGPDGGEGAQIRHRIENSAYNDQIRWEGPVRSDHVISRLKSAEVYVLPALAEPFGLTLLEAMAAALPVVLGEQSALAEQIVDAGAGRSFSTVEGTLESAIESFLLDPEGAVKAGEMGRALVQVKWSIEAVVAELELVYEEEVSSGLKRTDTRKTDR